MPRSGAGETGRDEFARVALPHLDSVFGAALYLTRDRDRASDLAQETFLRAFRFFHQFQAGTNCRAWLLTILHNTFRNTYRSESRTRGHTDIDDPATAAEASEKAGRDADPGALVIERLLDDEVAEALTSLPEEFRSAIVLVDLQDLSYEESATALGVPIGTVRSRLSRGRRLLQSSLREYALRRGILKE